MFTGIIEHVGRLVESTPMAGGYRVRVETEVTRGLKAGDSVAVNGVCLTVILTDGLVFLADIGPETARVTTFPSLQRDDLVNIEKPLRADAILGGHVVQGHVDGVGSIDEIRTEANCHWLTVSYPPGLGAYFIRKGSVAIDGVSLTIAALGDTQFDVQIIPFTWEHTALRRAHPGGKVNLECDVIGKYVARVMEYAGHGTGGKGQ